MKVSKAIEVLSNFPTWYGDVLDLDDADAVMLGIEALKAVQKFQRMGSHINPLRLPGETPEEEVESSMTIDEAIKYLSKEPANVRGLGMQVRIDALKLGTEALKAVKECRASHMFCPGLTMPGETPEEEK